MTTHDSRFDGCFFVAVATTRIYCRPICRVKTPKLQNCTFFPNAAAAEARGFRPCLRCRPELAPGNASVDASHRIAQATANLIEDGMLNELGLDGVAKRLGVTTRHLRRVFQTEFGVSPIEFAQTQRLLLAKRLLTDTSLPVIDVAFAAGFNSLRRFNALLKERYRLTPQQLRKSRTDDPHPDSLQFVLSYRPPYDWASMAAFLAARTISGVESVTPSSYRRIVRIHHGDEHVGWIEVTPCQARNTMRVSASPSLAKVIPLLLSRVKHCFDLSCTPQQIGETLGELARPAPGLRLPGSFDGFEVAVRAVLGQQVSVAAARTLAARFADAFGNRVDSPFGDLAIAFPTAETIAAAGIEDIVRLGILRSRAGTIVQLADAIARKDIQLTPGMGEADAIIQKLRSIAGIGEWTAQYIAMRALAWPDAFPHTDLGVMKAMKEKSARRVLAAAEAWRPWRAYAVMHLWKGLSNGTIP